MSSYAKAECIAQPEMNISTRYFVQREATDEQRLKVLKKQYDEGTTTISPEYLAYFLDAKNYVREHCPYPSNIDNMTQDEYKQYFKKYIDTLLEYLAWGDDYSNFFEIVYAEKDQDRVMEIINNHIPNIGIFSTALSYCRDYENGKAYILFEGQSGIMGTNERYQYYYTRLSSNDKNSPYFGGSLFSSIKSYEGFLDIKRYAETRDEKYLYSPDFFPDIVDYMQRDEDGNISSLKEIRARIEAEAAEEARTGIRAKRDAAYRNKNYVFLKIYAFYNNYLNCPQYFSGYTWYPDESLNGDLRSSIVETYGEDGYQKLQEIVSEAWENNTVQDNRLTIDLSAYYKS